MKIPTTADLYLSINRTTRLRPLAVSLLFGSAIIVVPLIAGVRFEFVDVTLLVRVAMVVSLSGAAFILDDPTNTWIRVLPINATSIAITRIGLALAIITPVWAIQLALAPQLVQASSPYQPWGLSIEAYGLLAWTWTAAWWRASNQPDGSGGAIAAPALFITVIASGFLPDQWALAMNPAELGYADSRLRWLIILAAGVIALAVTLTRRQTVSQRRT